MNVELHPATVRRSTSEYKQQALLVLVGLAFRHISSYKHVLIRSW